ncbi:MAG: Uncharacterized protein AUK63_1965 [bacterium P3]|nr:MAG: Uncharacterized protein AUK63_1965 [bacterium P3]
MGNKLKKVCQSGTLSNFILYLCIRNKINRTMIVVTGRDYRANLAKYYGLAQKGEDVVVKARYGSWKVVPITEDDVVVNKRDLPQELRNALMEVKESMEGKKKLMTWEELVNELDD